MENIVLTCIFCFPFNNQTEIMLWKQHGERLRNQLGQGDKENIEDNELMLEYQQLVAENTSLQKWYDKMKKDLARVRENQQKIWP